MNFRIPKPTVPKCQPQLAFILSVMSLVFLSGCTNKVDEVLIGHRNALLTTAEPKNFTSIETAQENVEHSPSITIEGQADLKELASDKPRALFLVREVLEGDGHGSSSHDPSSCPFCKRRQAAAPKAVVVFVDDNGDVIPYDIETLFSIEHGDVVVVEGKGELDKGLNIFEVTASSVFVRH